MGLKKQFYTLKISRSNGFRYFLYACISARNFLIGTDYSNEGAKIWLAVYTWDITSNLKRDQDHLTGGG